MVTKAARTGAERERERETSALLSVHPFDTRAPSITHVGGRRERLHPLKMEADMVSCSSDAPLLPGTSMTVSESR